MALQKSPGLFGRFETAHFEGIVWQGLAYQARALGENAFLESGQYDRVFTQEVERIFEEG